MSNLEFYMVLEQKQLRKESHIYELWIIIGLHGYYGTILRALHDWVFSIRKYTFWTKRDEYITYCVHIRSTKSFFWSGTMCGADTKSLFTMSTVLAIYTSTKICKAKLNSTMLGCCKDWNVPHSPLLATTMYCCFLQAAICRWHSEG